MTTASTKEPAIFKLSDVSSMSTFLENLRRVFHDTENFNRKMFDLIDFPKKNLHALEREYKEIQKLITVEIEKMIFHWAKTLENPLSNPALFHESESGESEVLDFSDFTDIILSSEKCIKSLGDFLRIQTNSLCLILNEVKASLKAVDNQKQTQTNEIADQEKHENDRRGLKRKMEAEKINLECNKCRKHMIDCALIPCGHTFCRECVLGLKHCQICNMKNGGFIEIILPTNRGVDEKQNIISTSTTATTSASVVINNKNKKRKHSWTPSLF